MHGFCSMYNMDTRDHFSHRITMELTNSSTPFLVRLTGGAAEIDFDKGLDAIRLLTTAFKGYKGRILYGGTRVIKIHPPSYTVIPTIMEVAPILKHSNPEMVTFGVVPRPDNLALSEWGIVISQEPNLGCVTIVNPHQDVCLMIQQDVDTKALYDVEWQSCLYVAKTFQSISKNFGCALVSYEGGNYTRKEILAWASNGLPVLLMEGSGRTTDVLCRDKLWLESNPSVTVCKNERDLRKSLISLGGISE